MEGLVEQWETLSSRHYARYQAREISFQGQRRERVRGLLGREFSDEEADRLFDGYLRRYEAGWTMYSDTVTCLTRLKDAGVPLGILTNGDRTQQLQKIDRFGLSDFFDAIVCSSDLPHGKPHPIAFEAATSALGYQGADVLMVGDNVENDVRGALAAGLRAVLLDRDGRYEDGDLDVIATLDDLEVP